MSERSTSGRTVALVLVPTAVVVAGIMLALRMRMEPPTVPAYSIGSSGPTTATLHRGDEFTLDLTPAGALTGAIAARGFLIQGDHVRPWDPPFKVDRDGTVHIAGPVETLFAGVPAGEWDVAIAVGRPETLPTAPRDLLRPRDADAGAAWRLVRERVTLGG